MDTQYAPTEPVPFDRQTPLVPPWHDEIPSRLDPFSQDDCALLIDFYLRRLVSLKNRVDPGLAAGLARMRGGEKHGRLGFVRMKDYAEECLDLDWRRARYLMTIHDAFQGLPLLAGTFENGQLSWTKAREITSVADAETQGKWLDFASTTTVRLLAGAVRRFRATGQAPWESSEQAGTGGAGEEGDTSETEQDGGCVAVKNGCSERVPGDLNTSADNEQWSTFSSAVPFALRRRWEEAVEACRRHAGGETPLWECAEYMAAEILDTVSGLEGGHEPNVDDQAIPNSSGLTRDDGSDFGPGDPVVGDHGQPVCNIRSGGANHTDNTEGSGINSRFPSELNDEYRDPIKAGIEQETNQWSFLSWAPVMVNLVGQLEADLQMVKSAAVEASGKEGARCLHQTLLRLVGYHELIERYLGRLLRFFGDHRLHQRCRFLSLRHYARERLGVSARQVGYLTSRERVFLHHPELERAFLDGRIGSAKVRLLEPFARQIWPCDWSAWIERAEKVTVRRLADETSWAVDYCQREPAAWQNRKGVPPAPGEGPYALIDSQWHMCSGDASDVVGIESVGGGFPGGGPAHHASTVNEELYREEKATVNSDALCPAPGLLPGDQGLAAVESSPPLISLIRFTAPSGAAAVWSRAVEACRLLAGDNAPTWRCLEMIVDHFLLVWAPERDPEHLTTGYPNAVFQRDGWRCTVPGCRTRSNLTPHHIVKRSRGGGDEMANLTTVCWKHHLEGIHRGLVWVNGRAPHRLVWELGRKVGESPVLEASGDWILGTNGGCDRGVNSGPHSLNSRTTSFS